MSHSLKHMLINFNILRADLQTHVIFFKQTTKLFYLNFVNKNAGA